MANVMRFSEFKGNSLEEMAAWEGYEMTLEEKFEVAEFFAEEWEVAFGHLAPPPSSLECTVNQRLPRAEAA